VGHFDVLRECSELRLEPTLEWQHSPVVVLGSSPFARRRLRIHLDTGIVTELIRSGPTGIDA